MDRSRAAGIEMGRVAIVTGTRGVGKTTVCWNTITLARARGATCGGIVTQCHDGAREVHDVRTGEVRRLTREPNGTPAVVQGRFRFDPDTLSWASRALARSVPCDLLVIDEIGPLEVERGEGWTVAFDVLRGGAFELAMVVVRPELVARAQLRLPGSNSMVLTTTRENRDGLPAILTEMLNREE